MPDRVLAEGSGAVWTMQIQGKRETASPSPRRCSTIPAAWARARPSRARARPAIRPGSPPCRSRCSKRDADRVRPQGVAAGLRRRRRDARRRRPDDPVPHAHQDDWLLNAVASRIDGARRASAAARRAPPAASLSTASRCATQDAHAAGRRRAARNAGRRRLRTSLNSNQSNHSREEVMTNKTLTALAALAVSLIGRSRRRARGLQNRHLRGPHRLRRDRRPRLAGRRRGRGCGPQCPGRHHGPQDRGHHRGQQVRASGGGDGLSQDDHSSDHADIFLSGCVSAGNFAGAPLTVRAQIPMVLCSILPQNPDHVKWAFSTLPPAGLRGLDAPRYLKNNTKIKKIRRAARPVALREAAEEHRGGPRATASNSSGSSNTSRTTPISASRSSKMHAAGAARDPQDRPRRHHADRGQEHQAARPRHAPC